MKTICLQQFEVQQSASNSQPVTMEGDLHKQMEMAPHSSTENVLLSAAPKEESLHYEDIEVYGI